MLLSESVPQHKRKASALDLNAFEPSSCKERRSSDQEGQEGLADAAEQPAEPQEDAPALVLTDRSSMHLMQLRESQDELMKQIDDITGARRLHSGSRLSAAASPGSTPLLAAA
jgi:hypothetical protein